MAQLALFFLFVSALASCGRPQEAAAVSAKKAVPVGAAVDIPVPLGLPPVPVPDGNKPTADTIALGKKLYYDPKLSADDTVSCASCHAPAHGFTDGSPVSTGVGGKLGGRSAPTVINAAYNTVQFWDGRAASLEEQAAGPIANPVEMNLPHAEAVKKLNADAQYPKLFEKAFGPGPVTLEKVQLAIASFERTVIAGDSPFDRYQFGGDKKALPAAAVRGLALFQDAAKGNCAKCHTIDQKYALFTDGKYHNLGVGMNAEGELSDLGKIIFGTLDHLANQFAINLRIPANKLSRRTEQYLACRSRLRIECHRFAGHFVGTLEITQFDKLVPYHAWVPVSDQQMPLPGFDG